MGLGVEVGIGVALRGRGRGRVQGELLRHLLARDEQHVRGEA